MKRACLKNLKNYQKTVNDEQQRTWLRLHTDKPQLSRGLGEDWQELVPYQGAKYFSYNRKVLDEIRKEKRKHNNKIYEAIF